MRYPPQFGRYRIVFLHLLHHPVFSGQNDSPVRIFSYRFQVIAAVFFLYDKALLCQPLPHLLYADKMLCSRLFPQNLFPSTGGQLISAHTTNPIVLKAALGYLHSSRGTVTVRPSKTVKFGTPTYHFSGCCV